MSQTLPLARIPVFFRNGNSGSGSEVVMFRTNLRGHARLVGSIHSKVVADAGYPIVRQSLDGVNWDYIKVIPQDADPNQPDFVYPIDEKIRHPYVEMRFRQSSGGAQLCNINLEACPDSVAP